MSTVATRWSALLKRELIEHRKGVIYAPWSMVALLLLLTLLGALFQNEVKINGVISLAQGAASGNPEILRAAHMSWMFGFFSVFHAVAGLVMFAYALSCLFDERKDRSTLFWRSLPVRDVETVLAKALTLLVLIPLSYLVALATLQLAVALVFTVVCLTQGVNAWQIVWQPIPLFHMQGWQLGSQAYTSLWVLPAFGWCLFCSAYAKQRPFLLAVLLPGSIIIALATLRSRDLWSSIIGKDNLLANIFISFYQRIGSAFSPLTSNQFAGFEKGTLSLQPQMDGLLSWQMWVGILIGVAFIAAAAFLRRYREDAAL